MIQPFNIKTVVPAKVCVAQQCKNEKLHLSKERQVDVVPAKAGIQYFVFHEHKGAMPSFNVECYFCIKK